MLGWCVYVDAEKFIVDVMSTSGMHMESNDQLAGRE